MEIVTGSFIYNSKEKYQDYVKRLITNGIKNIRINCSNYETDSIIEHVLNLKKYFNLNNYKINIYLDLPFPGEKTRFNYDSEKFEFYKNNIYTFSVKSNKSITDFYVDDIYLIESLSVNECIYIDDGKYLFKVIDIKNNVVYIKAESDGIVLNKKAIYTEKYKFTKRYFEKDKILLEKYKTLLRKTNPEFIILSFCEEVNDILSLNNLLAEFNLKSKIIPKIETINGIKNLCNLIPHVETLMLGRGDLGSTNESILTLGNFQDYFIKKCHEEAKMVLIATDILSSLTNYNYIPNRADVLDLYYILKNKAEFVFSSAQIADDDNLLSRFCEICNRIKINS